MSSSQDIPSASIGPVSAGSAASPAPWHLWWLAAIGAAALVAVLYHESLAELVRIWSIDENYGHGFFVPLISGYLIWEKRQEVSAHAGRGSWWGLACVAAALALYFIGEMATLYVLLQFSFWLVVVGLMLAAVGTSGARTIVFPLAYLLTMIPLPQFLYQGLSGKLQLLSSMLGVGCLQLVGVTAFREGNIIDLGPIQLQVVEACSGLRYIFPLASLALLCAYLFKDRLWKRVLLVLSSFPISILLNSFRIAMIGVLVELYGEGMAEGFSHLFEGWLIFVVSLGILFVEMWALARIGRGGARRPLTSLFSLGGASATPSTRSASGDTKPWWIRLSPAYVACLVLLLVTSVATAHGLKQEELVPLRQAFVDFPSRLDAWTGSQLVMEQKYVDELRFDDYLLADYRQLQDIPVNFYVAYYRSQQKGQSAHSPRSCMPGGGWEIVSLRDLRLRGAEGSDGMMVNRALIQKGEERHLVLYWFQQRGRVVTNEYFVKWYLLWDAVTRRRTDGALVRLVTPIVAGESEPAAEARLVAFAETIRPLLPKYVPD